MIGQFIITDLLLKNNISKKNIFVMIMILNVITYSVLLNFFFKNFSFVPLLGVFLFFGVSFYSRIKYLKKYLGS